jgi:hypothetical protein
MVVKYTLQLKLATSDLFTDKAEKICKRVKERN